MHRHNVHHDFIEVVRQAKPLIAANDESVPFRDAIEFSY
jgi:hypothetical protein